jgi:hypothetical protein
MRSRKGAHSVGQNYSADRAASQGGAEPRPYKILKYQNELYIEILVFSF